MSYVNDKLWIKSKALAKSNGLGSNWIEIVDYYREHGGYKAMVHAIISDVQKEIIQVLDDERVLLIDSNGQLSVADYHDVEVSRKLFFYRSLDSYVEMDYEIPDGGTYKGTSSIKVRVV